MPPLLNRHPFIDGLNITIDNNRKKDIIKINQWLNTQAHLPQFSDEFIYLFLYINGFSHDKTKFMIENYATIRSNYPTIFSDRDAYSPKIQTLLQLGHLIRLPKTTPEGYKVLLYSVKDPDPRKFNFSDAVKGFCMYNDCVLSEDGITNGYMVVFDMKGVSIGHLARVSLPALRAFMLYIQEGHPFKLRGVHVLNAASWVHHIMRIILPLTKSEMLSLVKFHKGNYPENSGIPLDILPMDYGGEAPTIDELDRQTKNLVNKYADWLRETEYFKADETKRLKKTTWWGIFNGANQTTATIKLDEKTVFKNLQID